MINLKAILFLCLCILSFPIFSQNIDWEKLAELDFEKPKDYTTFEPSIPILIQWLENHSLHHPKRTQVNAAMILWLEGTPSVMITLEGYALEYTKKNPDFLMLFMTGWTKYVLENPDQKDNNLQGNLAGLNSILDFYEKGKDFGVKKDRKVAKLLKKREAGKLEEFITKKIN